MIKNKKGKGNSIFIILILLVAVGGYFLLKDKGLPNDDLGNNSQSTSGELIRTVPINGEGNFVVTYSGNFPGNWGAIIVDEVSNGCLFSNGKTTYKSVMLGDGPTSQQISVTGNNCVFTGNFNLVDSSSVGQIKYFGTQTVQ